jgi:hypothetical protein
VRQAFTQAFARSGFSVTNSEAPLYAINARVSGALWHGFQPVRTTPLTDEEALNQLKSTAALVLQVTFKLHPRRPQGGAHKRKATFVRSR